MDNLLDPSLEVFLGENMGTRELSSVMFDCDPRMDSVGSVTESSSSHFWQTFICGFAESLGKANCALLVAQYRLER